MTSHQFFRELSFESSVPVRGEKGRQNEATFPAVARRSKNPESFDTCDTDIEQITTELYYSYDRRLYLLSGEGWECLGSWWQLRLHFGGFRAPSRHLFAIMPEKKQRFIFWWMNRAKKRTTKMCSEIFFICFHEDGPLHKSVPVSSARNKRDSSSAISQLLPSERSKS